MMNLSVFSGRAERAKAAQAFSEYVAKREKEYQADLDRIVAEIKSPADVELWQRRVREGLDCILGPFPERTPLRPRVVGRIERPKYIIEKVIFESRPRYYVTANLYVPRGRTLPAPGILMPCGHEPLGKAGVNYRNTGIGLALKGYVALVFDPTGQGERLEGLDPRTGRNIVDGPVSQHHWTGKPCLLTGTTLAGHRTWDGIRAIDYLVSRKEVDPERIGVVGNSGGGAMTLLISAVDRRVKACAAAHPGGSCEDAFLSGLFPPDRRIVSLLAPRPCLIIVGRASHEEPQHRVKLGLMKPFYEACGVPERVALTLTSGRHDIKKAKRVAAYEWLNRWLEHDETSTERPFEGVTEEELHCTRTGQVLTSLGGTTMQTMNSARARAIAPQRSLPRTVRELERQRRDLLARVESRIAFERTSTPLKTRSLGAVKTPVGMVERLVFDSEPGMPVPALLFVPRVPRTTAPVVIHTSDTGKPERYDAASLPARLARLGLSVLSIDVRDVGETSVAALKPAREWRVFNYGRWAHERLASRSLGFGRTVDGMRALDVIRAVDMLSERGDLEGRRVAVVGEGRGGVWATYAAAFDSRIAGLATVRTLASYRYLTDNAFYNQFDHWWTPGVLSDYDLPELPALLAPRPVAVFNAIDHMGESLDAAEMKRRYAYARRAYNVAGCGERFVVERTAAGALARRIGDFLAGTLSTDTSSHKKGNPR